MVASDKDHRYSYLLNPIRDLSSNWRIDIASELEEYLAELESITVSFDGGDQNLNFAEAALLIQGSVCIYGKKVEYLYNLLYQTLDAVLARRKKRHQQSSIDGEGKDNDAAMFDDDRIMLPLDDLLQESKNIDLDESTMGTYESERKNTLIVRPVFSQLQQESGFMGQDGRQYRISQHIMHSSGALLLDEDDSQKGVLNDSLQHTGVKAANSLPFGSPQAIFFENQSSAMKEGKTLPAVPPFDDMGFNNNMNDEFGQQGSDDVGMDDFQQMDMDMDMDMDEDVGGDDNNNQQHHSIAPVTTYAEIEEEDDDDDEEEDMWEMLDPHSTSGTGKPYKKGKTYKVPDQKSLAFSSSINVASFFDTVHHTSSELSMFRLIAEASVKAPYYSDFASVFTHHQKMLQHKQLEREAASKKTHRVAIGTHIPQQQREEDDDGFNNNIDMDMDMDMDMDNNELNLSIDGKDQFHNDDDNDNDNDMIDLPIDFNSLHEEVEVSDTYENMCKLHVRAYVQKAEKYFRETQLSKRVSDWQEKLDPILSNEYEKGEFDIVQCGTEIVDMLAEQVTERKQEEISFENLVDGKEQYEVCRMFLASLQLANNGSVDIIHSDEGMCLKPLEKGEPLPMEFLKKGKKINKKVEQEEIEEEEEEIEIVNKRRKVAKKETVKSATKRPLKTIDNSPEEAEKVVAKKAKTDKSSKAKVEKEEEKVVVEEKEPKKKASKRKLGKIQSEMEEIQDDDEEEEVPASKTTVTKPKPKAARRSTRKKN